MLEDVLEFIQRCRVFCLIILSTVAMSLWPSGTAQAENKTLLIYGDSLSAAYGIGLEQGWVALMETKLRQSHPQWQVVNLSISGETTSGGLSRLPKALEVHKPDLVILELGANDGLRGTSLKVIRENLDQMLKLIRTNNSQVLLLEMHMPPNYGPAYTERFNAIFHELGEAHNIPVMPFFLDGIAGHQEWIQNDGLHPNAEAQPKMLAKIWPELEPYLKDKTLTATKKP